MSWRSIAILAMACCGLLAADCLAQTTAGTEPSIQYVEIQGTADSPPGMFKTAVIVDKMPLVHTRQLFPLDTAGKLIGEDSEEKQVEQVLSNLQSVLSDSGSAMNRSRQPAQQKSTPRPVSSTQNSILRSDG